jgi:hypothetical protein
MTPSECLLQVKEAAYHTNLRWRGNSDAEKSSRAIAGYELGLVELTRHYTRITALLFLDPNKSSTGKKATLFNVSERHIRRVETIRKKRPDIASRLESIAMRGTVSLEVIEHLIIHPPSADTLEATWLAASDEARTEFLKRIGK